MRPLENGRYSMLLRPRTSPWLWTTTWFVIVAAVGLASSAKAASPKPAPAVKGVVRIVNRVKDEVCLGSGTLVDRERRVGVVLTCAHLFSDGVGQIYVAFPHARPKPALVMAVDELNDLACLAVQDPSGPAVPIAKTQPTANLSLASCGYGQDGKLHVNRGRHLGYATLRDGIELGVLEISGAARQGDSGGPIFDAQGQVVAVIMGTDGQTVDGTHCGRIRQFLAQNRLTTAMKEKVVRLPLPRPIDEPLLLIDAKPTDLSRKPGDGTFNAGERGKARFLTRPQAAATKKDGQSADLAH